MLPSQTKDYDSSNQKPTWFAQMSGYLKWKVTGPKSGGPFDPTIPYNLLHVLVNNKDVLKNQIKVRCLAEGYEVLQISNYARMEFSTSHPCLSSLTSQGLAEHLTASGEANEIEHEIDKIQEDLRIELERRTHQAEKEETLAPVERRKIKHPTQPNKMQTGTPMPVRLIKR